MARVYIYVMNSIINLNGEILHSGCVPWPEWWDKKAYYSSRYRERLNYQYSGKGKIFFGPCKKGMRYEIRNYIKNNHDKEVYIVGLSNNCFQPRNIIYFMKIDEDPMTFEQAYNNYPNFIGTGIHIKPLDKNRKYSFYYYKRKREISLKYKHLGVTSACKKAPHENDWILDIAKDYSSFVKTGPDCCFISDENSYYFGNEKIKIDTDFCQILKEGNLNTGKLNPKEISNNYPIPNPRGKHLILEGSSASKMIKKLDILSKKL